MPGTPPTSVFRCANPGCGVEFTPRKPWQKYHSPECRRRHWRRGRDRPAGQVLTCPHCGQPVAATLTLDAPEEAALPEEECPEATDRCRTNRGLCVVVRLRGLS